MKLFISIAAVFLLLACTKHEQVEPFSPCGTGTDSNGMVFIDPTDEPFFMGSDDAAAYNDEKPVHAVQLIRPFWMDSTEITQGAYDSIMVRAGHTVPLWSDRYGKGESYPAYNISWGDAVLFCNARSVLAGFDSVYSYSGITTTRAANAKLLDVSIDLTKNGFRLPTEAEWEYAARAGSDTSMNFFWGNDVADSVVNKYCRYSSSDSEGALPVASALPNSLKLYDMAGNVSEWCNDYYDPDFYEMSILLKNPVMTDPLNELDENRGWVIRGGHWYQDINGLRSSARDGSRTYSIGTGFRTVRNAE